MGAVQFEPMSSIDAKVSRYQMLRKELTEAEDSLAFGDGTAEEVEELEGLVEQLQERIDLLEEEAKRGGWYHQIHQPTLKALGGPKPVQVRDLRPTTYTNSMLDNWRRNTNAETTPTTRVALHTVGSRPVTPAPLTSAPAAGPSRVPSLEDLGGAFARTDVTGIRKPTMDPGLGRDLVQALWLGFGAFLQIAGGLLIQRLMMGHSPADFGSRNRSARPIDLLEARYDE